jgi:uncharacterized protein DUF4276
VEDWRAWGEPLVTVRIYVEGGFEGSTKANCRRAFSTFLGKVVPKGSFKVIASGDRASAFKDFSLALRQHRADFVILLVDSEEAVTSKPWKHLADRVGDGWVRPTGADDEQVHLMVQVMEAWFLADHDVLVGYYGQGFLQNSLPGQPDIEVLSKQRVYDALIHASKRTRKGEYHKTRHGFDLLEKISPQLVRRSSAHAERFLSILEREAARSA